MGAYPEESVAQERKRERERERERERLHRVVTNSATRERQQRSIVLLNGVSSLSLSSSLFSVSRSPARSLVSEGLKRLCPGAHGQCLAR